MDATETRILDAALEAVAAGASTMDDIAARAGVGRVTLFRRFGSKDALMERLYAREVERFLAQVDAALSEFDDPADRIAEAFVACVREGARHPLLATVPRGAVLEVLSAGDPSPLEVGRRFVAERLEPRQEAAADLLVRLALTYVLIPSQLDDEQAARAFARAYLAPIATASAPSAQRAG
jgi:TetR/AcrR family transcriptional regulator, repressor for uid operon